MSKLKIEYYKTYHFDCISSLLTENHWDGLSREIFNYIDVGDIDIADDWRVGNIFLHLRFL